MTPLEIEVKFYLTDLNRVRNQVQTLGAVFERKTFEHNVRFEDADNSLIAGNALLRLRKTDHQVELTYKGEPAEKNTHFKVHRELEVAVSDFDTMRAILEAMGYHAEQNYEKQRETYRLAGAVLCFDRMPFGDFLEIEGEPDAIRECVRIMGLAWEDRILTNYLAIFERLKTECGLDFNDVTFDNFSRINLDFSRYHHLFTAG